MNLSIHNLYAGIFKVWRVKRFQSFLRIMAPKRTDALLDVGGYPAFWGSQPPTVRNIDCINIDVPAWDPANAPRHQIRALSGDGCQLPFADHSYEILYSNSVIEHVGSWERQQAFAREARRVGSALWIQTPAFECPIEPHYIAPFIHWLPARIQKRVLRWGTPWGWIAQPSRKEIDDAVETTRLLTKREMRELFPDCELLTERLFGILPKSYIAVRKPTAR